MAISACRHDDAGYVGAVVSDESEVVLLLTDNSVVVVGAQDDAVRHVFRSAQLTCLTPAPAILTLSVDTSGAVFSSQVRVDLLLVMPAKCYLTMLMTVVSLDAVNSVFFFSVIDIGSHRW